ncbi:shTK domain protein [Ancylostoma ceylanicum]|uniref:ShTK domain protein n=1 Tax=Ancylostoma ceylanicum TaxID=53326 RepID=A0A0D6LMR6_9BILA|nr:shTK domain protein [Ancylostoma ceylanicum]
MNFSITDDEYSRKLIHMMSYNTPGMLPTTTPVPPVTLPPVTMPPMQSQCNQCQSTCGQTCQQQIPAAAPVCQQQCQQICQPVCNPAPVTQPPPEIKVTVQESAVKGMNCQPNCESACNQQCVQLSQTPNQCGAACLRSCAKTCAPVVLNCLPPVTPGSLKSNNCVLANGKLFGKALRKEYRVLSNTERNRVELALRLVDPSVAIPYWDSALDSHLPSPRDSVLWSDELLGGAKSGEVKDGAFKGWKLENARESRELDYPQNNSLCSSDAHFSSALMRPFDPLLNTDGLSNDYTGWNFVGFFLLHSPRLTPNSDAPDFFYSYSPRVTCSLANRDCGSNCGFAQFSDVVVVFVQSCFNENECCGMWAESGHCKDNPSYMLRWCQASCNICTPNYNITLECSDRYSSCSDVAHDCHERGPWMRENCRKSMCALANFNSRRAACRFERPTSVEESSQSLSAL